MYVRALVVAALAAAAFQPPASAATGGYCEFGPQIGTACLIIPDLVWGGCHVLEGQDVLGIKCND